MAGELWVDAPAVADAAKGLEAIQRHLEHTLRNLAQIAAACECLNVDGSPSNEIRANLQKQAGPLEQIIAAGVKNVEIFAANVGEVAKHVQAHDGAGANSMPRAD